VRILFSAVLSSAIFGIAVSGAAVSGAAVSGVVLSTRTEAAEAKAAIGEAVSSATRTPKNVERDRFRHPAETLTFFGVTPEKTVVEIWPGPGWYTEILAPLLKPDGKYIAATEAGGRNREATLKLLASDAGRFDKVDTTTLKVGEASDIAPEGTADIVLTFRNVHNFLMKGDAASAQLFKACYRALKPGGVLGIVDHHLPEEADKAAELSSGYVKKSTLVKLAEEAGFKLDGESDINANPKDDHNHPKGVWTLPPVYALGETDRAKYREIGESDRLTLRFVKPAK